MSEFLFQLDMNKVLFHLIQGCQIHLSEQDTKPYLT
jgi:hypothetical protein